MAMFAILDTICRPFIDGRQFGKHSVEALGQLPIVHGPGLENLMPIGRFYLGYELRFLTLSSSHRITQHQHLTPFTGYLSTLRDQIRASAESKVLTIVRMESSARVYSIKIGQPGRNCRDLCSPEEF
jgi:hypothetical protein